MTQDENLLRLAFEAIERGVRDGYWNKDTVDVSAAIQKRLLQPQPKQEQAEPVAWRVKVDVKLSDGKVSTTYQLRNTKLSEFDEPLYTKPQPSQKPLTDEQIDKAWRSVDYTVPWEQHRIDIAQAIEAAHGIKE